MAKLLQLKQWLIAVRVSPRNRLVLDNIRGKSVADTSLFDIHTKQSCRNHP